MNLTATGTQFVVNSLLKSSRPGKSSLMVSFPAFPENEQLCAHSTLLYYVAKTASIRQSLNSSQVFVSYGKPKQFHLQLSQDGLKLFCRQLKLILVFFKGHSFRGASTSKAVSLGLPLDVILNAADWKKAGTFAKFYQRETSSVGQFAQAVLTRQSFRSTLCLCLTNKVLSGEAFIVWCYILRSGIYFELCNLNPAGRSIIRKRI